MIIDSSGDGDGSGYTRIKGVGSGYGRGDGSGTGYGNDSGCGYTNGLWSNDTSGDPKILGGYASGHGNQFGESNGFDNLNKNNGTI